MQVETIKDIYMVASGLPHRNGDAHVREIANFALKLITIAKQFSIRHLPAKQLLLRVGFHSGSCAAGNTGNC